MKVLFLARHSTYFRNFDSVIQALAEQGHVVHLAVQEAESLGGSTLVDRLTTTYANVSSGDAPSRERDRWARLVTKIRLASDYLRYLGPAYAYTPRLRERAAYRAPAFVVRFGASRWSRVAILRSMLRWALRSAEMAVPGSAVIEAYLEQQAPDLLLVTPLIGLGSQQVDYVRAARTRGIPSALCVWSWDHLSSKSLIRDLPDRLFVWNETQRDEAMRLHQIPAGRIVVTGAQCFDRWFDRRPSRTRDAFAQEVGLDPAQPIILYVCSAPFGGSPPESQFVLRWISHLRGHVRGELGRAGILVRPHPQRTAEWESVELSRFDNVALRGGNPVTPSSRDDYFNALAHSAVVVGLNTSAFLEAAIASRPVLVPLPEEFRDSQEGTIHFHYLTTVGGGLLTVGRTLDEHAAQLVEVLTHPVPIGVNDQFVEAFIRPNGLDQPATPRVVQAACDTETLAVSPSRHPRPVIGRIILKTLRAAESSRRWRAWMLDAEGRRTDKWARAKAKARAMQRQAGLDEGQRAAAEADMRERHRFAERQARQGQGKTERLS